VAFTEHGKGWLLELVGWLVAEWSRSQSDERLTRESCPRLRGGVQPGKSPGEKPHLGSSQSVRSSASKPGGREPNGTKASNDRWSEGTQEVGYERERMSEENLSTVGPQKEPKQDKEALRERWEWVEHSIWTDRMLRTLDRGIEGGKWFALIDKVYRMENLRSAFYQVWRNDGSAGIDGQKVRQFEASQEQELQGLSEELQTQSYQPAAVKRVWIPKPASAEKRPLGIPVVRDRVVQTALRNVIEPIFERDFAEQSYGFRPRRGTLDALRRVEELLNQQHHWVVDADIKGYFDNIPHTKLMAKVAHKISDGRILKLIESFLQAGVMEEGKGWEATLQGTPQGGVVSPLLANIYLDELDWFIAKAGMEMVRYADDFVVLCRTEAEAQRAMELIKQWMEQAQLRLHPQKTKIIDASQAGGFDFLGYHFERGKKWPRTKSVLKVREAVRKRTRRSNGQSLDCIITGINPVLRGWYNYFRYSNLYSLKTLDSWVRGRLRSILRKRIKRKGKAKGGLDHRRWPNRFFDEAGLFNLTTAWEMGK
jgi:RNA-directed DNA polymerase